MGEGIPATLQQGVWQGEAELLGARGEHIPVSQVVLAHRSSAGEVAYFSTIMRDITDRKRLEDTQQFLLEASRAFSGSLEIDAVLQSIIDLTVPARADFCAIELLSQDGKIERTAVFPVDPAARPRAGQIRLDGSAPHPLTEHVIRSGEALLIGAVTDEWLSKTIGQGRHLDRMRKLAPSSLMVVPLRGRDRIMGTICFCITKSDKRYLAHDLALAEQMAAPATLALENARLFQQSREATRVRDGARSTESFEHDFTQYRSAE
jgi:GAF domain-containing protein